MDGYQQTLAELEKFGAQIIAACAEPRDKVAEGTASLTYPVGFGVTKEQALSCGAWWEDRRQIIQATNFVLNDQGKVLSATYSTGPVGRLEPADAVRFLAFQEKQKQSS